MRADHSGPYQAAVTPKIADLYPELTPETLLRVAESSQEIVRFDAEIGSEIAPFSAVLLRSESISSSRIENLTSGARQIAAAEIDLAGAKRNAAEIVGNVRAMRAAISLSSGISANSILEMHRALLSRTHPGMAGRWRTEQVWIGGTGYGPHRASFIPPHHDRVEDAIEDLVGFAGRDDIPALVHAAVAHAQFETIHPFPDGNGRTGRALLHSMLRARGLTRNTTVPISAGLLTDPDRYFSSLTDYRRGDPNPIVQQIAAAAQTSIHNSRLLAHDVGLARRAWGRSVTSRQGSTPRRLIDLLVQHPVVDGRSVSALLGVDPSSARSALGYLADLGILHEFSGGKRNRMWEAKEITSALDAFAERAGRRRAGNA